MANKMSDEKNGQGAEYYAQEMEEAQENFKKEPYQDRSAQLRASLTGLAMANAGSLIVKKREFEKNFINKKKNADRSQGKNQGKNQSYRVEEVEAKEEH